MTKFAFVQGVSVVALVLVGCASNDGGGGGGDTTKPVSTAKQHPAPAPEPTQTMSPTEPPPGSVCAAQGDKGNNLGIGAYCEKGGKCASGQVCSGDFGGPVGWQFCTVPCASDADCGEHASCFSDPRGKGCVPTKCLPPK